MSRVQHAIATSTQPATSSSTHATNTARPASHPANAAIHSRTSSTVAGYPSAAFNSATASASPGFTRRMLTDTSNLAPPSNLEPVLIPIIPVHRNPLRHAKSNARRPRRIIRLRILLLQLRRQPLHARSRLFRSLAVLLHQVHLHQHALTVRRVVQSLCRFRAVGIPVRIFLVQSRFHLRTLRQPLPVAAKLIVDQV